MVSPMQPEQLEILAPKTVLEPKNTNQQTKSECPSIVAVSGSTSDAPEIVSRLTCVADKSAAAKLSPSTPLQTEVNDSLHPGGSETSDEANVLSVLRELSSSPKERQQSGSEEGLADAVAPLVESTQSRSKGPRCAMCKALKKGKCGTTHANPRCLWRPGGTKLPRKRDAERARGTTSTDREKTNEGSAARNGDARASSRVTSTTSEPGASRRSVRKSVQERITSGGFLGLLNIKRRPKAIMTASQRVLQAARRRMPSSRFLATVRLGMPTPVATSSKQTTRSSKPSAASSSGLTHSQPSHSRKPPIAYANTARCDVCVSRKKGKCGTEFAISRCLWRPKPPASFQPPAPPSPEPDSPPPSLPPSPPREPAPGSKSSTYNGRRCKMCTARKKGKCGT
eukprot:CAMPEP_0118941198 /NCGR_PEP_ID=MMETSP1169-20130426/33326_1 /TAXON_ID=36882 /ORGANISM="Pyramimonas obovata, Strain CCMP722" /LENGTH=396 /DNA_ID=CAMNT_0006885891 /DNA_START=213 /DNA_END=1399 /DNA_ORIENTATION=-